MQHTEKRYFFKSSSRRYPLNFWRASIIFVLIIQFSAFPIANAQNGGIPPIFSVEEPLDLKLKFSFKETKSRKGEGGYNPNILLYRQGGDTWDSLQISLRARGNFRRDKCYFTPIKIKMKSKEAKNTPFQGNKTLKMVLPCQNAKDANDYLIKEYITYKLFEPISEYHFNTKLVNLSLTDEGNKQQKSYDLKTILIEDDELIAQRFNGSLVKDLNLHPLRMKDTVSVIHDFYQFFIGNVDWSSNAQHNVTVMKLMDNSYIPLIYDFDMSGFVNAPYSETPEFLPITSVRTRLYRGFCRDEALFEFVRAHYLEKETEVWASFESSSKEINPREIMEMKKYITEFYDILKNDKRFREEIFSACRTQ